MPQAIAFVQANPVLMLSALLIASLFFSLGLLMRRRHVIQILPAPVSPGLEKVISAALASREIVYVQPVPGPASATLSAGGALSPSPVLQSTAASAQRQALSKPEEIVHAIEKIADKLHHEDAHALDAAARDALLDILAHMEHHSDDDWFKAMHDKLAHAKHNSDLSACAAEMIKHLHH
ncbi:MAG: hypothetical protein JO261_15135 [Alphaproteobacteria bacterium]|nr:hypothetical protein [Alphaproteobacteria bacterium]MBV9695031.1 hypothetical protein [Alphaproteobacteria bacterium]